jgi:hypothetical protein
VAGPGNANAYDIALTIERENRQRFLEPLLQGPLGKLADKDITTQNAINALFPKEPLVGSEGAVSDAVSAIVQRNPRAAQSLVRAYRITLRCLPARLVAGT